MYTPTLSTHTHTHTNTQHYGNDILDSSIERVNVADLMLNGIFRVVANVGGGNEIALNVVFSRAIETLLEHLIDVQAVFSIVGAKVFKEEMLEIVKWIYEERGSESDCHNPFFDELLDADVLNRLHAIIEVLCAPLRTWLDENHKELALCMELLPDLDVWLSMRQDKGKKDVNRGKVGANGEEDAKENKVSGEKIGISRKVRYLVDYSTNGKKVVYDGSMRKGYGSVWKGDSVVANFSK